MADTKNTDAFVEFERVQKSYDGENLVVKDLNLSLPVTQHIRDRFDHFVHQMGGADLDHAGLYLELQSRNSDS